MRKKLQAEFTIASVAVAGIAPVPAGRTPAAEQTVLEAQPVAEVLVAAFVAGLADIVEQVGPRVLRRTWHHHLGVDSSHFEERHRLGRPESGVASRPSPRYHFDSG